MPPPDFLQTPNNKVYARMFELSNDAVMVVDRAGWIRNANARARSLFGYENTGFTQCKVFDLHPADVLEQGKEHFRKAFAEGFSRFNIEAMRKDGEAIEVEVSVSCIEHEDADFLLAIVRELTEQNQALRQIETLSQFPEQNPYPVIRVNAQYQLEYANEASQPVLDQLNIGIGDALPQAWQQDVEQICRDYNCRDQKPTFECQLGSDFYLFTVSFIQKTGQAYLYGQDITELKNYQEQLKKANEELSTFIYKTHHDLKNPVSTILGLLQLGEQEVTDANARQYLQMIRESTTKLDTVLQSLIHAIEIKDSPRKARWFDLREMISDLINQKAGNEGAANVKVAYEIAPEAAWLYTDREALSYALENLIGNAIKYRDENKSEPYVQITAYRSGRNVVLTVEDNGLGVPEGFHDRIFDMFYRATNARKGSGMGLYIVKKCVKKMQGSIGVSGKEGMGTLFTISIPYEKPDF